MITLKENLYKIQNVRYSWTIPKHSFDESSWEYMRRYSKQNYVKHSSPEGINFSNKILMTFKKSRYLQLESNSQVGIFAFNQVVTRNLSMCLLQYISFLESIRSLAHTNINTFIFFKSLFLMLREVKDLFESKSRL